jgi:hypothetical protein
MTANDSNSGQAAKGWSDLLTGAARDARRLATPSHKARFRFGTDVEPTVES